MNALLRPCAALLATVLALGLSGCAMPRLIDSDVQSFVSGAAPQRPALYRFERLPSQNQAAAQESVEALAAAALAKVGLTPAPLVSGAIAGTAAAAPAARYALQVGVQVEAIVSPYAESAYGGFWGRRHPFAGLGMGLGMEEEEGGTGGTGVNFGSSMRYGSLQRWRVCDPRTYV